MEALKEKQYSACFEAEPVTLGPMASEAYRRDPKHLGFTLARYKFVSKMLAGMNLVAEIGCADAFGSRIVAAEVNRLDLYDFDPVWEESAERVSGCRFTTYDLVRDGQFGTYEAIFLLDVMEHVPPEDEEAALSNIVHSLTPNGVAIIGCPSLESQIHASHQSKIGHVNCRSGNQFRSDMLKYFKNVFAFCQNDEVVHTGFMPMAHYLFMLCIGPLDVENRKSA